LQLPATPAELGLPQAQWRPVQIYGLQALLECQEPVVMLQAPPGTGKTLLAAAWALLQSRHLLYTCVTKDLQDQWVASFPALSAQVRGRDNYPTLNRPELFVPGSSASISCDDCTRRQDRCAWCADVQSCPYTVAKAAAAAAPFAVLNLAYWLREANSYRPVFSVPDIERQAHCWRCHRPLHAVTAPVCATCRWLRCTCGACGPECDGGPLLAERLVCVDEADELSRVLEDHISVSVDGYWMERLSIPEPRFRTANAEHQAQEWLPWLEFAADKLSGEAEAARRQAAKMPLEQRARRLRTARRLEEKSAQLLRVQADMREHPGSWVRGTGAGVEFKPVGVARHAHPLVFRHARRFLLMSATFLSKEVECEKLGLDPAQVGWVDLPSTFPVQNRPVFYWPVVAMTYKSRERAWPQVVQAMDMILDAYPERGLVHTHSYDLQRYVVEHSRHRPRLLWYVRAAERAAAVEALRNLPGAVLVAPSLERGISLDEDLCRVVIVLKMPAANLSDPQVSAKFHAPGGWLWYRVETARALVQSLGRGVRSEDDWADGWILDAEFGRVWATRHILPSWFVEGVITDTKLAAKRLQERGKVDAG
jgi:Rad3-related DNA helicase